MNNCDVRANVILTVIQRVSKDIDTTTCIGKNSIILKRNMKTHDNGCMHVNVLHTDTRSVHTTGAHVASANNLQNF